MLDTCFCFLTGLAGGAKYRTGRTGGGRPLLSAARGTVVKAGEEATETEASECSVCWNAPTTHALSPCGHRCVCGECAEVVLALGKEQRCCPICRAWVADSLRVWLM
ncbi:hypothetical protein T484DRAFT_1797027 [Baffinella frigidus]|nr:hypothetical protein T484DRAFT_1797027 [Cryptophyta sp. CCMP2293]